MAGKSKHGLSRTITYSSWKGMVYRCTNKDSPRYHRYGGRGIKVCKRWLKSITNFVYDMGLRPSKDHTIDRINVDKGYYPKNCRWATEDVQQNNRADTVYITYLGRTMSVSQWAREFKMPAHIVYGRYKRKWPLERIFNPRLVHHDKNKVSHSKPVSSFDSNGLKIKDYPSMAEVTRELNAPCSNIVRAIKKNGVCRGYYWKYQITPSPTE